MGISTAVDANAVASVVGIETKFKATGQSGRFLPQRIAVVGQGATSVTYSTTKEQVTSASVVGQTYGFGSPLHLAVSQLLPANGDGVGAIPVTLYPLDDDGAGVAAAGDITPVGIPTAAGSFRVKVNNILSSQFAIAVGDVVATMVTAITTAINSELSMPVIATDSTTTVDLVAKWKGESGNDIQIEIVGTADTGTSFTITQPASGASNPDVQPALDQIGAVWETLVLNCLNKSDTVALDAYNTFGEGRWNPLVKKQLVVFTGDILATVALATTIPELRKTQRTHSQLVSPSAKDLPLVVAARELARIAVVAENNPPTGYNGQVASGLTPSTDAEAWEYLDRDEAIKKGSSTITLENGQVVLGDIVTFYHPDGEPVPAYNYVVNIIKLQNITYNLNLIFESPEWRSAPLIPNDAVGNNLINVNPNARTPAAAQAEISVMLDYLGSWAIISNPAEAKALTVVEIDGSNPNRLNIALYIELSGNTRIKSITENFSYFFGG